MSIIAISNTAGRVPTVNQLLMAESNLGYNRADALLYGLKVIGGVKTVVCLGESLAPGTTHARLHSMLSSADHAAGDSADYDKLIGFNATTGAVEAVSKSSLGGNVARIIELKIVSDIMNPVTGDGKLIFCIPLELNGMNLQLAHAYLTTAASGITTIQIRNITAAADILTTPITIDSTEVTSYTATTPPVINATYEQVSTGDLIAVDVDTVAAASKGLGVILTFNN